MSEKNHLPISGGKAVVECLKAHNVKYVFGLIGSATMELFDALYDEQSISFIDVRDERTGTHMADAYARASGSPGVIIAGQNGPGATNLVTGVAQAKAAFSPLLSIAGAIATEHAGTRKRGVFNLEVYNFLFKSPINANPGIKPIM